MTNLPGYTERIPVICPPQRKNLHWARQVFEDSSAVDLESHERAAKPVLGKQPDHVQQATLGSSGFAKLVDDKEKVDPLADAAPHWRGRKSFGFQCHSVRQELPPAHRRRALTPPFRNQIAKASPADKINILFSSDYIGLVGETPRRQPGVQAFSLGKVGFVPWQGLPLNELALRSKLLKTRLSVKAIRMEREGPDAESPAIGEKVAAS
jgi:hypothetical protein